MTWQTGNQRADTEAASTTNKEWDMTDTSNSGENTLRKNSLGLLAVTFMVISAAAPLTGVAGAMPLAFLLGNGTGVPLTFALLTLVMLAFAAGYVAMSRHVTNAGAFYAYAARGLGGGAGGAVSVVALVAYNAMQFGLIGLFGNVPVLSSLFAGPPYGIGVLTAGLILAMSADGGIVEGRRSVAADRKK